MGKTCRSLFFLLTAALFVILGTPMSGAQPAESTVQDQVGVELTVYNNNIGCIKDLRKIRLVKGAGQLRFTGVPANIIPESVSARSLAGPDKFNVLEQDYKYDVINSGVLLDKYSGKDVKLIYFNEYQGKQETVSATVLNGKERIFSIGGEIYLDHPGYVVMPLLPEGLVLKPTLQWLFDNTGPEQQDIEVSYLTRGLNWKADYVMILAKDDLMGNLSCWVTVDNRSGTAYKNAKLKLVAGEVAVNQGQAYRGPMAAMADYKMESAAPAPQFAQQALSEYHMYELNRKTTIDDQMSKQISFLKATGVKTEKELVVYGRQGFYRRGREEKEKIPVEVHVKFKNSKASNLGMPLPAGTVKFYKTALDGSLQFIGEDNIGHTALDEEITLNTGSAFDVVAERTQIDYAQRSDRVQEFEWEIVLRNHKTEDVYVGVVEPMQGDWNILSSSHKFRKESSSSIRFDVKVPKDGEVKVKYRVQVKY